MLVAALSTTCLKESRRRGRSPPAALIHLPHAERPLGSTGCSKCTALGTVHGRLRLSSWLVLHPLLSFPAQLSKPPFPPPSPPVGRGLSSGLGAARSHRPTAASPSPAQAPRAVRSAPTSVRPTIGASISVSERHNAATARHAQHGLCGVHTATALLCPGAKTRFRPGLA